MLRLVSSKKKKKRKESMTISCTMIGTLDTTLIHRTKMKRACSMRTSIPYTPRPAIFAAENNPRFFKTFHWDLKRVKSSQHGNL